MRSLYASILMVLLLSTVASANEKWQTVGQGEMRWAFFKIYDIKLLSENGTYEQGMLPTALEIEYHRDISAQQLIDATRKQMRHIAFEHDESEKWFEELSTLWPDIKKGDILRLEIDSQQRNMFYYNGELIGGIDSPDFSKGFVDIWLSPRTSEPALRNQLING